MVSSFPKSTFDMTKPKTPPASQITIPHNADMEQAVIGGCLIADMGTQQNQEMLAYAVKELNSMDFYYSTNRTAFRMIGHLQNYKLKKPEFKIDLMTAVSFLRRFNKLDECTPAYLTACIESCPSVMNMPAYVQDVLECSRQRQLILMAETITHKLTAEENAGQFESGAIINNARAVLDAIENHRPIDIKVLFNNLK